METNFNVKLTRLPKNTFTTFPTSSAVYKIYKDGNHYVGTRFLPYAVKRRIDTKSAITVEQRYFDKQYVLALQSGVKARDMFSTMKTTMLEQYSNFEDIDNFISNNIKRKKHNFYVRLKRFKRKANLNLWNKFVTITYDDKKMNAETFRTRLRKCLSNLHTRRKWRYMGVFELGEDNKRLHFHALMYIPDDKMIGKIIEKRDYSIKQHAIQITHSNTFFADKFGRNDFEDLSQSEIQYGNTLTYLTKYLHKTNGRIIYSRGIPTEIYKEVHERDIATEMLDFVIKYVFYDDIIDIDKDIMHFEYTQGNIFDEYYSRIYKTG